VVDAQVKQAALDEAPFAAEEAWVDEVAQAQPGAPESESEPVTAGSTDPTIANATLTEINAGDLALDDSAEATSAPAATSVDTGAANAAAEDQWDKQASGSVSRIRDIGLVILHHSRNLGTVFDLVDTC
jgi:hypothetical protein